MGTPIAKGYRQASTSTRHRQRMWPKFSFLFKAIILIKLAFVLITHNIYVPI